MGNDTVCSPDPCPTSSVQDTPHATTFKISPAAPNPSSGHVRIAYQIPGPAAVSAEIFDAAGSLVRRLAVRHEVAGRHEMLWDGRDGTGMRVLSGVYLVKIKADGKVRTAKVTLTK